MTKNSGQHSQRRIVLVDIECLVGGVPSNSTTVEKILRQLLDRVDGPDTQFVVASSHCTAMVCANCFGSWRQRWRSGPDGADLALVDIIESEDLASRYAEVVIASGDGIFAPYVARLAALGVRCVVVSRERSLSRRLRLAAHEVILLDEELQEERVVAA